jgi:hypothetical protein
MLGRETPDAVAVSCYLAIVGPQLAGGYPPGDPEEFFNKAVAAYPDDAYICHSRATFLAFRNRSR